MPDPVAHPATHVTVDGRPMPLVLADAVDRYLAAVADRAAATVVDGGVDEQPAEEA